MKQCRGVMVGCARVRPGSPVLQPPGKRKGRANGIPAMKPCLFVFSVRTRKLVRVIRLPYKVLYRRQHIRHHVPQVAPVAKGAIRYSGLRWK